MVISFFRTLLLYGILIFSVRLMGKRQIGEMEPAEFVVAILIANFASIPMEDPAIPLLAGLLPIGVILGSELVLSSLSLRSIRVRRVLCGKPVILVDNGRILEKNLRKTRVNLDELTMHLREKDIFDLSSVKFAILETNGQISVLLRGRDLPATARDAGIRVREAGLPVTLISGGQILEDNLPYARKDLAWLKTQLRARRLSAKEVLLFTVDRDGKINCVRREP